MMMTKSYYTRRNSELCAQLDELHGAGSGARFVGEIKAAHPNAGVASVYFALQREVGQALRDYGAKSLAADGAAATPKITPAPEGARPTPPVIQPTPAPLPTVPVSATPPNATRSTAIPVGEYFNLSREMFGSLTPRQTGDDQKDRAALAEMFSQFNLTCPGINSEAAAPSGPNIGLQERLASSRQARVDAWHSAMTSGKTDIISRYCAITNEVLKAAFRCEHERELATAVKAMEHDDRQTAPARKPLDAKSNDLLAEYQAITDPKERSKFLRQHEAAITVLLRQLR